MNKRLRSSILAFVVGASFVLSACASAGDTTVHTSSTGNRLNSFVTSDVTANTATAKPLNMESAADSFTLMDVAYGAEEKFVYTATVSFENGVAAGLAFGSEDGSH